MDKNIINSKLEFLYKSIEDSQNIIRFTDSKAGAIIAAWVAIFTISYNISVTEKINVYFVSLKSNINILEDILLILIIILASFFAFRSIWLVFLAIKPKNNPCEHIDIKAQNKPENLFYICSVEPKIKGEHLFLNTKNVKLQLSTKDYIEKLNKLDDNGLILELSYELQKLSFIRELKITRVNYAIQNLFYFLVAALSIYIYGLILKFSGGSIMANISLNVNLFIVLFVSHLIADYLFQTDRQAIEKQKEYISLIKHSCIYTISIIVITYIILGVFSWNLTLFLLLSHTIIDKGFLINWWLKYVKLIKNPEKEEYNELRTKIDQVFHIIILFLISLYIG